MPSSRLPLFGDLLKRYRAAAGLTQEELARRAGLSPKGISDLERRSPEQAARYPDWYDGSLGKNTRAM